MEFVKSKDIDSIIHKIKVFEREYETQKSKGYA